MQERRIHSLPGSLALVLSLAAVGAAIALLVALLPSNPHAVGAGKQIAIAAVGASLLGLVALLLLIGMFTIAPNEARVMQLFGRYVGTTKEEGWRWVNPFYSKRSLSLRMRSFETPIIKVNDVEGNPIEIGAIVVWRVVDTAAACFVVDDYASFVRVQAEAAVRNLATHHPYDGQDERTVSLRGHTDAVSEQLQSEIAKHCHKAGVEILEAKIAHLAYAPEIAQAMLQRQQAGAIIAARQRIVEGAVGMVEMALTQLARHKVVELDEERKAAMVSNLLVVLCGERATQPVINAGTLHQG
ncbi:MAG: SPFH domain-containing protein [Kofleriaceae bacterium]|nr:SPFH domain-containing protein [Kofleriaceae bacterium]MBP9171568.1 SPFH domain-containing protein [Kofleriaceae bacterium]MBP9861605.1 SPFH domain-containing protein [Kofleriaceae bacterium]